MKKDINGTVILVS